MRIEMLSTVKHETPEGLVFQAGEVRQVSDAVGRLFCAKGWAKDLDNRVPTGERVAGATELDVHGAAAGHKAEI